MNLALLKNGGLATLGVLVQGLARFVYTILVGRVLGAETLGQVSSLLALAVFVSLLWPTASGVAASRFIPRDVTGGLLGAPSVSVLNRYFYLSLPILAVVTFGLAVLITRSASAALAAVALMATYSGYMHSRGAALGSGKFVRIAIGDVVSSSASILLLALVLIGGWHWAVLLPLSLGYLVFSISNWPRGTKAAPASRGELRNFVAINSLAQIATGGLLQVAMLAAAISDNPYESGLFAAALSLATPAAMLGQSLNQVLIQHFAGLFAQGAADIRQSTVRMTLIVGAGLAAIFGTIALLAPVILRVLYGSDFVAASSYMLILLAGVYIFAVSLVPAATLIATGRDKQFTVASVAGFLVGVATMGTTASALGAWSAGLGYALGSATSAVLTLWWGLSNPASETSRSARSR